MRIERNAHHPLNIVEARQLTPNERHAHLIVDGGDQHTRATSDAFAAYCKTITPSPHPEPNR